MLTPRTGTRSETIHGWTGKETPMSNDNTPLDRAGKQAVYITDEWSTDPATVQTQALCYVGIQLERIADALEEETETGDQTETG